jgi:hypothetical protein
MTTRLGSDLVNLNLLYVRDIGTVEVTDSTDITRLNDVTPFQEVCPGIVGIEFIPIAEPEPEEASPVAPPDDVSHQL